MYYLIVALATFVALSTVAAGLIMVFSGRNFKFKGKTISYTSIIAFALALGAFIVVYAPGAVKAATSDGGSGLAYLAAGLSTGLAAIGAGIAVATVGAAALGALSEDPKVFGKTLIYVGLAEGIAIYGLIISIMIITGM